jgi:hypothetical protein
MEEYLTWLLRDQSKVIGSEHYVELQFEFDRAQTGDDLGAIRSVEVGGFVPEKPPGIRGASPSLWSCRPGRCTRSAEVHVCWPIGIQRGDDAWASR